MANQKIREGLNYFYQCHFNHNDGMEEGIEPQKSNLLCQNIDDINGYTARMLCDIHWSLINYQLLSEELGEKINFFDLELVGALCREVTVDPIKRVSSYMIRLGSLHPSSSHFALRSKVANQALHRSAGHSDTLPMH